MTANTEKLQILEKLFEENYFWRTLGPNFFYLSNHVRKFWGYFNSILTSYCTASVRHYVLYIMHYLTLKKTRLAIYVYIWLPRNSACVVKRKQTWPEQAVYAKELLIMLKSAVTWCLTHGWASKQILDCFLWINWNNLSNLERVA